MATLFQYNPSAGWNDTTAFPQKPANQAAARDRLNALPFQARDYINNMAGGWTPIGDTCTYASATSFTISADWSGILAVGDRLKLTNSSAKYFYVVGVALAGSTTTVTITGGSDYTLANAAITSPYFSKAASPVGFPDWFNWAPTFSAAGSMTVTGIVTELAKFKMSGREVVIFMHATFSLGGTTSNTIMVTLPIDSPYAYGCVAASVLDAGSAAGGAAILPAFASSALSVRKYDASSFTVGSAKQIALGGSYPI